MLSFLLLSLNGCLTLGDTLDPDGDDVLWPDDCDNTDSKILDAERTWSYLDRDGDGFGDSFTAVNGCETPSGYVSDASDCDDDNAMIHPKIPELCDGIDQDCDDKIDDEDAEDLDSESAEIFYADDDGDGFGDLDNSKLACINNSPNWVSDSTDCDDGDAEVNPNAIEECDEQDNNCNGQIDEDTIDKKLRYNDLDGDDFGDPDSPTFVCPGFEEGTTTKFRATDCDDDNEDIHPEADEICDEIDNNCDGGIDTNPTNGTIYYTDSDRDGFGNADSIVYSCKSTPPLRTSDNSNDCDDDNVVVFPGAAETCGDGIINDCYDRISAADGGVMAARAECPVGSDTLANAKIQFVGENSGDSAGASLSGIHDLNNDGCSELLIGSSGYGTTNKGGAFLVYGSSVINGKVKLSTSDYVFIGEDDEHNAGAEVTALGDWDADGLSDFLIGAPSRMSEDGNTAGAVYLYHYSSLSSARRQSLSQADVTFYGNDEGGQAGWSIGDGGDVNGDGLSDVLIGAPNFAEGAGLVYLVLADNSFRGNYTLNDVGTVLHGNNAFDLAGWDVAWASDFNGDGLDDILVSSPGYDSFSGAVYLIYGSSVVSGSIENADVIWHAEDEWDFAGSSINGRIDVDGDGSNDLMIGASLSSRSSLSYSGTVYVIQNETKYHSTSASPYSLSDSALILEGAIEGARAGSSLADAGDLNGDSFTDFIIGADFSGAGAAYVFLSPFGSGVLSLADAAITLSGESTGDSAGGTVAGIGDFDCDGIDDLGISAIGAYGMGSESGAVYVVSGVSLFDY